MKHRETIDLNYEALKTLKNNQLLHLYEGLKNRGKRFINKAIRINQTGEPFTFMDFKEIGKDSFKQYVFHLRHGGLVEIIGKGVYAYYRVKGFRLKQYWEKLTLKPTEVSIRNTGNSPFGTENIYQLLKDYLNDLEYPALHNIRLHFHHDYIYKSLEIRYEKDKSYDIQYFSRNKSFIIRPRFSWEPNCSAQIMLTPKNLVQIIIKNTFKPIACDENGIYELNVKLGEIREYMSYYSNNIPAVSDWYFVRADFGRDCKKPLHRVFPEMQFRDLTGALIRLYAKSWSDGKNRLRLEKNIKPNEQMINIPEILANTAITSTVLIERESYHE